MNIQMLRGSTFGEIILILLLGEGAAAQQGKEHSKKPPTQNSNCTIFEKDL